MLLFEEKAENFSSLKRSRKQNELIPLPVWPCIQAKRESILRINIWC
jgi:hypothetical protein